ncbi:type 1 glutamine amidotransferase domain-containing protein [Chitinophaga nivalis]|uniref:Type 1 glutamine amidotransferase domain-containing protein n=1 Tax=Chitinophaga nivalis TaxID=2991709 RepID=A0ABT3IM07_9BACT|nr:type 1 glutamine amidotransferase domain-containing protein [Chitinophaga nivalis]MCW3465329.1 type 1 glutamine amidotransferase domain-containing protein [Chitinophaga nivalis]MCW3484979.1 type 1 glutamine amidotransferase domain-containing protein [Chitinophaga nivalis]
MGKKILFVVSSHDQLGNTGEKTGFYYGEVTHAWEVLKAAGYDIDFVSPKGGKAPYYGLEEDDKANQEFLADAAAQQQINNTLTPAQINPADYDVIYYAGGHGTMWDFTHNKTLDNIASNIYQQGGIVSAVCHGVAGLLDIPGDNGQRLIAGKKINAFTNEEEKAVELENVVPFSLEDQLIANGAIFEKSPMWQQHVTVDGRIISGQNPQSAKAVGEAILAALQAKS